MVVRSRPPSNPLSRQKPLVSELNRPLSLVPRVAAAVTITTATSEAIKAYSIAVTPRRSRKNPKVVRLGEASCKAKFPVDRAGIHLQAPRPQ